jgi:Zn-dependent M16 (insulinase) family peptidase
LTSTSLHILSNLLLNGLNAPFYQSLIESNLGNNFSPGTGYDDSTRESVFSVGLQGIKEEDIPTINAMIFETLEKVAKEGFSQERIDGALHQIEIRQRHVCLFCFGLSYIVIFMFALGFFFFNLVLLFYRKPHFLDWV